MYACVWSCKWCKYVGTYVVFVHHISRHHREFKRWLLRHEEGTQNWASRQTWSLFEAVADMR